MKSLYQCSCNKIFRVEKDALACETLHKEKAEDQEEINGLKERLKVFQDAFDRKYNTSVEKPEEKTRITTLCFTGGKFYADGKEITEDEYSKESKGFWY